MSSDSPKDPTRSSQDVTTDFSQLAQTRGDSTPGDSISIDIVPGEAANPTLRPADTAPKAEHRGKAPKRIASYEILAELGRGGMGVVYHGHDLKLKRDVAIKVVLAGGHAGKVEFARFQTEAEAVARLKHPNVVQVYEIGEDRDLPFLALEYCPGGSLDQRLNELPPNFRESAELVALLADAVEHAHQAGIIHRDLKPANVLFDADGTPKLTDFGLAKKIGDADSYTRTGSVLGSAFYMSPEQASGNTREVTPSTDVYALGAILYRLLAGRTVFEGATDLETIQMIVAGVPIPIRRLRPACPRDLETICLKCLEKSPADRYSTAAALADDLRRYLRGEPIRARPATPLEQLVSWCRRNPLPTSIAVLSVAMLALLAGILAWTSYRNYRVLESIQAREMRVEELRGQILYLDEVLTGSALLASHSGDTRWDERYQQYEPQLAAALDEAIALVPDAQAELAAVQSANDALVALESRALELVRNGETTEAKSLLGGAEYAANKQAYSRGLAQFAERLTQHSAAAVAAAHGEARRYLTAAAVLGAVVLAILLLAAYSLVRTLSARATP
jgi:serine/threonine protein kinase